REGINGLNRLGDLKSGEKECIKRGIKSGDRRSDISGEESKGNEVNSGMQRLREKICEKE
ncbi:hypothetical protein, partial [Staphylococcus epidermidis]|uniref:hypothetical protein n=1 Tax=Staphylococcus epidermidis TaxID=1282 RepID=UPI001C9309FA